VKNPDSQNLTNPYYYAADENEYAPDAAFNPRFDISKPLVDVVRPVQNLESQVLVNYIDHSQGPTVPADVCTSALGNPTTQTGDRIPEDTLKVTDRLSALNTNSFYACVDTSKNIARVTIRGNSLRRIQTDANYALNKSAYFPTASVQVQGLGARGR
jgi:hypothetical protein